MRFSSFTTAAPQNCRHRPAAAVVARWLDSLGAAKLLVVVLLLPTLLKSLGILLQVRAFVVPARPVIPQESDRSSRLFLPKGRGMTAQQPKTTVRSLTATKLPEVADFWAGLWSGLVPKNKDAEMAGQRRRQQLKDLLILECQSKTNNNNKAKRAAIEALMEELATLSPIANTATSDKLQQTWSVLWTTEKEINLFLDQGWSRNITQQITTDGTLINSIPFVQGGGSFNVIGRVYTTVPTTSDPKIVRSQFEFERAILDLGTLLWGGQYELPPVGKGWFDTIYLDDIFRIDLNSRNDILICTANTINQKYKELN